MTHLLVTNDFPPKIGGIQSYLWELWRRLPPDRFSVLTTRYPGDGPFDAAQRFTVHRAPTSVLLPGRSLRTLVRERAAQLEAGLVVLDPALPLGLLGPTLGLPYGIVVHGAEVSVPGRLPVFRRALGRVLDGATCVVGAGHWPLDEATRVAGGSVPAIVVPPGVDCDRFRPLSEAERAAARSRFGLAPDARVVLTVSRLVPRKGIDVLVAACSLLSADRGDLVLVVAGAGRDRPRLERLAAAAPVAVRFLGRVVDADMPALFGAPDVFALPCRNRWAGLEQEGFGIVFLEAAACGVPQVAGDSGGAAEAVASGETGLVVSRPEDPAAVAAALAPLLDDQDLRARMGAAARRRAERDFSYDELAARLGEALSGFEKSPR